MVFFQVLNWPCQAQNLAAFIRKVKKSERPISSEKNVRAGVKVLFAI